MFNTNFVAKLIDILCVIIGTYNVQAGNLYFGIACVALGAYCILFGHKGWTIKIMPEQAKFKK